MARSLTTNFTVTGDEIIKDALRCLGVIASGENPTGQEITDGRRALNMMIKSWMGPESPLTSGLKVWQRSISTGIIPATMGAKISYTIGASGCDLTMQPPVQIIAMTAKNSDGVETSLDPFTLQEYFAISDKTATGVPTKFHYEREYDRGVVYFDYVVEDTSYTFPFLYLRELYDITSVEDDLDFPVHWYEAIKYHLAIRLAPEFQRKAGEDLQTLANYTLSQAQTFAFPREGWDFFFQPDLDWSPTNEYNI